MKRRRAIDREEPERSNIRARRENKSGCNLFIGIRMREKAEKMRRPEIRNPLRRRVRIPERMIWPMFAIISYADMHTNPRSP
jgi:hypothetical protein